MRTDRQTERHNEVNSSVSQFCKRAYVWSETAIGPTVVSLAADRLAAGYNAVNPLNTELNPICQ